MSTSSKTVEFVVNAGSDVSGVSGTFLVYVITEVEPQLISEFSYSLSMQGIKVDLPYASYFYAVFRATSFVKGGNTISCDDRNVSFLSVFHTDSVVVSVDPQSTVGNAFAFARMIRVESSGNVRISAKREQVEIAYGMKNNFIESNGQVSHIIMENPNGLETNSYPLFNFLSSLVHYNLTTEQLYADFLQKAANGKPVSSFLQAFMYIVHEPFTNVQEIYGLIDTWKQVYLPSLPLLKLPEGKSPVPDQWTLAIKVNKTGSDNFLFSGLAYAVFDENNRAWITNNFRAGTPTSGTHVVILEPNGQPAPFSPLFGGGLLGAGFGAAVSPNGKKIAIGNYGWGPKENNPQWGSVSYFTSDGNVVSPADGYTKGLSRVQGMCYDKHGNLWMASVGSQKPMPPFTPGPIYNFEDQNSAVVVYIGGNPDDVVSFSKFGYESPDHKTFDVVMDHEGNAIVCNMGTPGTGCLSSIYKLKLEGRTLVEIARWDSDYANHQEDLRQVQVDSKNNVYVAGIISDRIVKLDPMLKNPVEINTEIYVPWGITIDKNDTIFVSNFGENKTEKQPGTGDMAGKFGVTVIKDGNYAEAKLMTLPTGGEQVRLANEFPVYGTQTNDDGSPAICYQPLMRLTSTAIDKVGNLWCMNNWKPSAYVDLSTNPGGDGCVIFVGVAEPQDH